jgi:predicted RNase H-related nuclease YkuK (DUF458 family)
MDVSEVLQFLSGVLPFILVIFGSGGIVVAYIQYRLQKVQNLEEKIREERKKCLYTSFRAILFVI